MGERPTCPGGEKFTVPSNHTDTCEFRKDLLGSDPVCHPCSPWFLLSLGSRPVCFGSCVRTWPIIPGVYRAEKKTSGDPGTSGEEFE